MKKRIVSLLSLCILLSLLMACGSTGAGIASTTETPVQTDEKEPVVIETSESTESEATSAYIQENTQTEESEEAVDSEEPVEPEEPEEIVYEVTYPLTEKPVTLTLMHSSPMLGPLTGRAGVDSYGDVAGVKIAGEKTGVNIDWREVSMFTASEEFNLVVVSGDYPDMLSSVTNYYAGGQSKAYEDEVIQDLSEYVAEYAPDYYAAIKADAELFRQTKSDDGKTLAVYAIYDEAINNDGAMVRKDWLDDLGLEVPTNFDELTEAMTAIQTEKGVANPIYFNESCNFLAYGYGVQGFDMAQSTIPIYHDSETIKCSFVEDDYRDYITRIHDWYESGLINPNFIEFSSDLMSGETEVEIWADRTAIWDGMVTNMTNYYANTPDENFQVVPTVITTDGGKDHITLATRSQDAICLSTACDEVQLALGWINYWFQDEGIMLYNYGVEGDTYEIASDGTISYTDKVMNNDLGADPLLYCRTFSLAGCSFGYTVQSRIYLLYEDYQTKAQNYWTENTDGSKGVPTLSLTTEESALLATYGTDITTYAAETLPKFVMGDMPLSDWNSYVETLRDMHIDEIIDAYQAAYNRYLAR